MSTKVNVISGGVKRSKGVTKVPESPSASDTHGGISQIVNWMKNRSSSPKEKLDTEEKLMLYRYAVKSYNRYKCLVIYLRNWLVAFVTFTQKVCEQLVKAKAGEVQFMIRNWFAAYNEVLDEFLLLKFGAVTCNHDMDEHKYFLVDRNISSKEIFPNQDQFEHFTSCSFFGYRDLTSLIDKVCALI
jgi:hypothetical protein